MKVLLLAAAAAVLVAVPGHAATAPGAAAKKRCHVVVKRVHGHKKHVRVCTTPKPRPQAHSFQRLDVGGYKLALECWGSGTPTVVLDSGFGTSRSVWLGLVPPASTKPLPSRLCTYDRAGIGDSDQRPGHDATTAQIVGELHTLLARAQIAPPYVLGGWSIGGFDIRYYTLRYPSDVAGLVLVDGTPPEWAKAVFTDPLESQFETMLIGDAASELIANPGLGARPLVVLTHGISLGEVPGVTNPEDVWIADQRAAAHQSTNSMLVRALAVSHDIPEENPRLVAESIRLVVASVRSGMRMPSCNVTQMRALHGGCLEEN
jgi:hypothetical protein